MTTFSEIFKTKSSKTLFEKLFKKYDLKIFGGGQEISNSTSLYYKKINHKLFPQRFQHILKFIKIKQLGPILNLDYVELIKLPNFGKQTLAKVYVVLDNIIEKYQIEKIPIEFETPGATETKKTVQLVYGKTKKQIHLNVPVIQNDCTPETKYLTFIEALENELKKLPAKSKEMLELALIDGLTLEKIAKINHLTRERIRQIINGAISKISDKLYRYKGSVEQNLLETILDNPKLVGVDYFANQNLDAVFLTKLVARMYPDLPFEENRLNLKNNSIFQRHESIIHGISSILSRDKLVKIGEFVNQLYRILPENFMRSMTVFLSWDEVLITSGAFRSSVTLYPKYLADYLIQILSASDHPLSLDEIYQKIESTEYGKSSVKNKLDNSPDFYRIEKDLYGLAKHLPLSSTEIQSILNAANIILEKDGRGLQISNLMDDLIDSFPQLKSKYLLHSLIKNSGTFSLYRGMNFSLQSENQKIREVKDIVIELLIKRGVPLHRSVIFTEIKKERSFHENGWGSLSKTIPGLEQYFSGYYGLSSLHASNLDFLSGCEMYIQETMESELCPYTTEKKIQSFFKDYYLIKVFDILHGSNNFVTLEDAENRISFFVNKKWNYSSIVKTILYYQEKCTISESFLANYLRRVNIPTLKDTSKLSQHYIFHLRAAKKYVLLTHDIIVNEKNIVREYIQFLTITGHLHTFDQVTFHLNNKLKLSLTIYQTEAIYRLWIKPQIK